MSVVYFTPTQRSKRSFWATHEHTQTRSILKMYDSRGNFPKSECHQTHSPTTLSKRHFSTHAIAPSTNRNDGKRHSLSSANNWFHSTSRAVVSECIWVEWVRCCYRASVVSFDSMLGLSTQQRIVCAPHTLNYGSAHAYTHTDALCCTNLARAPFIPSIHSTSGCCSIRIVLSVAFFCFELVTHKTNTHLRRRLHAHFQPIEHQINRLKVQLNSVRTKRKESEQINYEW